MWKFANATFTCARPPLQLYGLEGRYAHALYSAAHKENHLQIVEKDLNKFSVNLLEDKKLSSIIFNPLIPRKLKKDFLVNYLNNQKLSKIAVNFLGIIVENGRYGKIKNIIKAFGSLISSHKGEIQAEVITAQPLDKDTMKEIESALHGFIKKGQIMIISSKIDPSLIGGMIVKIGDKYIDMSISTKLNTYKELISHV